MTSPNLTERLATVEGVMFDVDGCLVISDGPSGQDGHLLPGAVESVQQARDSGRRLCVFTNGTAQNPVDIARHLRAMGLDIADDEVLTPAAVAAELMLQRHPGEQVLVFGGDGMLHDFAKRGVDVLTPDAAAGELPPVAAVVIGWDTDFGRSKLQLAATAVLAGAPLYCTSDAPMFASNSRLNVGVSGFIAAGLTHVTGKPYEVVGKPSDNAMALIARTMDTVAQRVLVIGDDIDLESAMARRAGAVAGLVLTGTTTAEKLAQATAENRPDLVVRSMTELVELISAADEAFGRQSVTSQ